MLSPLAARKAEKLGYANVRVFHAGMPAWKKSGNLVVSNIANIEHLDKNKVSYILLDLRSKDQIGKGHLPNAVAAAGGKVEALRAQFPKYKKAPIILCNQHGSLEAAKEAFKTIAGWGYKQVSILSGGFDAWAKAGKKVAKGPAASEIKYVRKLMPGEMEVAEFKRLAQKPSEEFVIVDVRNPAEFSYGALPNAINIPLEEVESRLTELSKDKTLVLYCNTGTRAQMAFNVLKKAGFKPKYVQTRITFDKEKKGRFTIED